MNNKKISHSQTGLAHQMPLAVELTERIESQASAGMGEVVIESSKWRIAKGETRNRVASTDRTKMIPE